MAKKPFEILPIAVAAGIGAFVMYALVGLFDASNTKQATYAGFGFVTGMIIQIGVRLAGVS